MFRSAARLALVLQLFFSFHPCFSASISGEGIPKDVGANPEVTIAQGTLKGISLETDGKPFDRFLAIPYGEPPIGDLRYNPPVAHKGWGSEVYDASVDLNIALREKQCLQITISQKSVRGSEDCLYLNVWVAGGVEEALKSPLPVMVWIHGGAAAMGSSWGANIFDNWLYDQESMALHGNIVAVSLNYRLGPLGFLSTGDDASPGNYGYLDQVEALKWVKNNIQAFGGDPEKITIYGESAGAASVSFHMVSPLSKGLFQRGISQSGTVFSSWAVCSEPLKWAKQVAAAVGCGIGDSQSMMSCIRAAPVDEVVISVPLIDLSREVTIDLPWAAVVDGYFLPDLPQNLIGNSADRDYLLGSNIMDGHLFAGVDFPQINIDSQPMYLSDLQKAAQIFHINVPSQVSDAVVFQYKAYSDSIDDTFYKKAIVDLYSDNLFAAGTQMFSQYRAGLTEITRNTFVYLFSQPTQFSRLYPSWMGADHAEDLPYVFAKPFQTPQRYTDDQRAMSNAFMTYWTNFAWSGDPNVGPNGHTIPAYWKAYDLETRSYLEINDTLIRNGDAALRSNYRAEFVAFWDRLIRQLWKSSIGLCDGAERKLAGVAASLTNCPHDQQFQRETEFGCVQGESQQWKGIMYSQFLGIPYAASPAGSSRFTLPAKPTAWMNVRDATNFSKKCPQYPFDPSSMDEDCLYINVYAPVDATTSIDDVVPNKYPVLVWIHGGEYMSGDGTDSYDGGIMAANEKVIVVTFNYRLGSLGFFTTGDTTASGNYGMFDQNMALQWVVNNIASFGGDPGRIVIFGQGSGAASVQMHTLSQTSSSLGITRAILESGNALDLEHYPDQVATSSELGERLGCDVTDETNFFACVKSAKVEAVIEAQSEASGQAVLQFAPVVDKKFLTDTPENLMTSQALSSWSFVIGTNSADGTTHWDEITPLENGQDFHHFIESEYSTNYGVKTSDIEFEYTLWSNPLFSTNQQEIQEQSLFMTTDEHYTAPASEIAESAAAAGSAVYYYQFDRAAGWRDQQSAYPGWVGAAFKSELAYVWGDVVRDPLSEGQHPDDAALAYSVMNYWSNFAKTGDPNLDDNGLVAETAWPVYTPDTKKYLKLDVVSESSSYPRGRQVEFWNNFLASIHVACPVAI